MNYLTQGGETAERLNLLLALTKITSDDVKTALADYLVTGLSDATAANLNGLSHSNLKRALAKLQAVAATVEKIKELDWRHLKNAGKNQLTE
ncbi:PapB/FocB family fimbrial expression transcriptional regulator [Rheinheimera marina]|uniref:PapB/FocB family fimbrial expression transcriptional regulator n=1 Tax=Rheinheimera marina TaxID=1774958 RepID=A0ABV9JIP3_9GAMM